MRENPTHSSKVTSQALFAELVEVKQRSGAWVFIQTPDAYLGWVLEESLVKESYPYREDAEVSRLVAHVYSLPDVEYGPFLTLPHGSKLQVVDFSHPRWVEIALPNGKKGYIQKGDLIAEPFELLSFCRKFLGLPYTWGGRTSFGFDCSGFVQMVYRKMGIQLPRDAKDQFTDKRGKAVPLNTLAIGDLIFWGKGETDIRHVGMSFGGSEFIHASTRENKPYLRLSQLTDAEWSGNEGAHYPFRAARRFLVC